MTRRSLFQMLASLLAYLGLSKAEPQYVYDWQKNYTDDPRVTDLYASCTHPDYDPAIYLNGRLFTSGDVFYVRSGDRGVIRMLARGGKGQVKFDLDDNFVETCICGQVRVVPAVRHV